MFSAYLPSFLSRWGIPSPYSLSAALQNNILSFLLKRSLGHLLQGGQLDPQKIEAGIGSGKVEIREVHLDHEAINTLLPSLPLALSSGSVGKIEIQLPWPNLYRGQLLITVSDLSLHFDLLSPPITPHPASTSSSPHLGKGHSLSESLVSAADEALREDEEGRHLEQSIQESILQEHPPTPTPALAQEAAPATVISSLVENLLSRLGISAHNVRIHITHGVEHGQALTYELRVADFDFGTESPATSSSERADSRSGAEQVAEEGAAVKPPELIRNAQIRGCSVWMGRVSRSSSAQKRSSQDSQSSSDEDSDSSDTDTDTETDLETESGSQVYMEMSQAIPDLRQSFASSLSLLSEAGASLYQSALEDDSSQGESSGAKKVNSVASATDAALIPKFGAKGGKEQEERDDHGEPEMVFSIGSQPLSLRIRTTRPQPAELAPAPTESTDLAADAEADASGQRQGQVLPGLHVDIHMGTLALFLRPAQVIALLRTTNELLSSLSGSPTPSAPTSTTAPSSNLSVQLSMRAFHLVCAYESGHLMSPSPGRGRTSRAGSDPGKDSPLLKSIETFWDRPAEVHPAIGHLRFQIEGLQLGYESSPRSTPDASTGDGESGIGDPSIGGARVNFSIGDMAAFERISPSLFRDTSAGEGTGTGTRDAPQIVPLLLFDEDMVDQYTLTRPSGLGSANRAGSGPAFASTTSYPSISARKDALRGFTSRNVHSDVLRDLEIDAYDWRRANNTRASVRAGAAQKPRKGGTGTRSDARNGAGAVVTVELIQQLAPTPARTNSTAASGWKTTVNLAPVHFFADLSLADRLLPFLSTLGQVSTDDPSNSSSRTSQNQRQGNTSSPGPSTIVRCPLIRVGARLPSYNAARNEVDEQALALGLWNRGGIVLLDFRRVECAFGLELRAGADMAVGMGARALEPSAADAGAGAGAGAGVAHDRDRGVRFSKAPNMAGPGSKSSRMGTGTDEARGWKREDSRSEGQGEAAETIARVEVGEVVGFLKGIGEPRAKAFVLIRSLAACSPDPILWSEDVDDASEGPGAGPSTDAELPLCPSLTLSLPSPHKISSVGVSTYAKVHLPSLGLSLSKAVLDNLQLLADDGSQWAQRLATAGGGHPRDDEGDDGVQASVAGAGNEPFGERRFGRTAYGPRASTIRSTSTDSTATATGRDSARDAKVKERASKGTAVTLGVDEIDVRLYVPCVDARSRAMGTTRTKPILVLGDELNLVMKPGPEGESRSERDSGLEDGRSKTIIDLSLSDMNVLDLSDVERPLCLLKRTMEPSLTRAIAPMLVLQFASLADDSTNRKESKIELAVQAFTLAMQANMPLADELKEFFKAPEGAFEQVEPVDVTRICLRIRDVSVHFTPPSASARVVLTIGHLSLRTKLVPDSPETMLKFSLAEARALVIDQEVSKSVETLRPAREAVEYWTLAGFARVLDIQEVKGVLTSSRLMRPDLDVQITRSRVKLLACADTLGVIAELAGDLSAAPVEANDSVDMSHDSLSKDGSSSASSEGLRSERNLLESLDEDAFRGAAPMSSVPDLLEDDLPSNPEFLGDALDALSVTEEPLSEPEFFGGESVASLATAAHSATPTGRIISSAEGFSIRLLDPQGIKPVDNYFTDPNLKTQSSQAFASYVSTVRVRVSDCDVSLHLHAGYDWVATHQAIEEEAKRVRRRLQKIKQLLAEGQTPDDSVEAATNALFDSVHITLPSEAADMNPGDLISAMDEELGDQSETASQASAWQPLPAVGHGAHHASSAGPGSSARRRTSKLQRSRKSMIDINLNGVGVDFDAFDAEEPLASRVAVTVRTCEIIDNLKTSTWRTFLTEMAPQGPAFKRNPEARMVHVELQNVRPEMGEASEETRMRAKVAPLRLHVDQDALDFLKKFFAFRPPGAPPAPTPTTSATGPFIQHAEVYPIKLKLDYKPKRVNYNLLREGKTIELMNFFHFDGAEMTLRHVTLRGITGWPRLFDTLNDIWTPDVKANQLADVLSGVAPIRSLVNVGAGMADLVLLPIEQYQKDGRIVRGVQKGATSFAKTTALEVAKLGARLATGTHVILEQAEHVLGGRMKGTMLGEAVSGDARSSNALPGFAAEGSEDGNEAMEEEIREAVSRYADQPEDLREALAQAYQGLSKGFNSAAQTILAVPMEIYERGGGEGGARPVVRAVPIAMLRGAMGASEAVSKTLLGLRNSLDPDAHSEAKYKRVSK